MTGSAVYTAVNTKALVADLSLDVVTTSPFAAVQIRFPSAAAGVQVILSKGATTLALPVAVGGDVNDIVTFANRRIVATVTLAGPDLVVDCEIRATAAAVAGEVWSVRASAPAGQSWQFAQNDNQPADLTITRIMCDPVAAFTIAAPSLIGSTVRETDAVTLTAAAATGTAAAPTVIGTPAPPAHHSWTKTGFVAITEFPACAAGPALVFNAPGVYGSKSITLGLQVWFEGGCPGPVGFLSATAATQPLTIDPRPQHLALVLDRSGSMSGARWENAKNAAQILANLYVALRSGVHAADRVEEIVFEDAVSHWHLPPISPLIGSVLGPSAIAAADGAIAGVAFGSPGTCTPIGDGLIKAIDDLATLGVTNNPHFTIVLVTDGHENTGSVVVSPNTPAHPDTQKFAVARQTGMSRQDVNARLSFYTIGLGALVQEDVLDALAGQSQGVYRHIVDASEVGDAMAQMVSLSQAAQRVIPDPPSGSTARVVKVDPGVSRLAVAVEWLATTDTIELASRRAGGTTFTPVAAAVKKCPKHGFAWVDVAAMFGGDETAVPATEWEIVHRDNGGTALAIPDGDLLVFVDLFVRADIVFDRDRYDTGDDMVITARLRAGDEPITEAKVVVELARPSQSLGTFLATNGARYKPGPPNLPDPHAPKAAMLADLLRRHDLPDGLPIKRPPSIFADGSAELFDDGAHDDGAQGDGNFANRFVDTDMEGTYTWRFTITGVLSDGSEFSRVLTVSKWVGISIDPQTTKVVVRGLPTPDGSTRTAITVYPRDPKGEFLGPFRPEDVIFKSSHCPFESDEEQTVPDGVAYPRKDGGTMVSRYDGGYRRVVLCGKGERTEVTVTVKGVRIPVKLDRRREDAES
ncbi:vWA domain-containing protein [Amycolatopsis sp. NPDC024027]|uniref:vWA domain-containing protein n=1 Tax=Amycolatopsis sp. NPDC024027 TaxID=3154327 RepID=UPI0033E3C3B9